MSGPNIDGSGGMKPIKRPARQSPRNRCTMMARVGGAPLIDWSEAHSAESAEVAFNGSTYLLWISRMPIGVRWLYVRHPRLRPLELCGMSSNDGLFATTTLSRSRTWLKKAAVVPHSAPPSR